MAGFTQDFGPSALVNRPKWMSRQGRGNTRSACPRIKTLMPERDVSRGRLTVQVRSFLIKKRSDRYRVKAMSP